MPWTGVEDSYKTGSTAGLFRRADGGSQVRDCPWNTLVAENRIVAQR